MLLATQHSTDDSTAHSSEIEVGDILGNGSFCTVFNLAQVNLILEKKKKKKTEENKEEISSETQGDDKGDDHNNPGSSNNEYVNGQPKNLLEMMRHNSSLELECMIIQDRATTSEGGMVNAIMP